MPSGSIWLRREAIAADSTLWTVLDATAQVLNLARVDGVVMGNTTLERFEAMLAMLVPPPRVTCPLAMMLMFAPCMVPPVLFEKLPLTVYAYASMSACTSSAFPSFS